MRSQYWIEYPRNFANEYHVYRIDTPEQLAFIQDRAARAAGDPNQSISRISRRDAIHLAQTRPRLAKKYNEQWFGGWGDISEWMNIVS